MNKITKMSLPLGLSLLICFIGAFSPSGKKKVKLELNLKPGDVFRMEVLSKQDILQNIDGMEQETQQSMLIEYVYKVLEAQEDTYLTEISYERVKTEMTSPGLDQAYDSANPPEEITPSLKGVAMLVGEKFTIRFKKNGEVLEIKGLDDIFTRMMDSLDIADEAMKAQFGEQMRSQFGNEAMKKSMEGMHRIYPDKPVAIGDSWSRTMNLGAGPIPMQVQNEWTLEAIEGKDAIVSVQSTVSPVEGGKPLEMMNLSISYDIKGTQKGSLKLVLDNGWPKESSVQQNMAGEVEMSGMLKLGAPEDTKRWPITFASTIETRKLSE